MSPRLASAMTSSPAPRARRHVAASAAHPGAPRRSKHATCGLAATHAGPAAAISAAQCASTAAAARSAGEPSCGAASTASGHSRAGSGSSPRTTCERRSATSAASRAPKRSVRITDGSADAAAGIGDPGPLRARLLERSLELGPGRELRHARGRDVDRLAGARVHALARAALGDAELAEAGEVHLAATLERVLDGLQHRINGLGRLALAQSGLLGDLIDELRLGHAVLLLFLGKTRPRS